MCLFTRILNYFNNEKKRLAYTTVTQYKNENVCMQGLIQKICRLKKILCI